MSQSRTCEKDSAAAAPFSTQYTPTEHTGRHASRHRRRGPRYRYGLYPRAPRPRCERPGAVLRFISEDSLLFPGAPRTDCQSRVDQLDATHCTAAPCRRCCPPRTPVNLTRWAPCLGEPSWPHCRSPPTPSGPSNWRAYHSSGTIVISLDCHKWGAFCSAPRSMSCAAC